MNCKNFLGRIIPCLLSFFLCFASISMSFAQEVPSITFTTSKKVGEIIILNIDAKDRNSIIVEGVKETYSRGNSRYTLTSQNIKIYGNITSLYCPENALTSLDISKNTELESLDCRSSQLTSLDLSKNTKLQHLECQGNQLTQLDISKNTELEILNCRDNQLTNLNLEKLTKLKNLECGYNKLTSLDLSKNTKLEELVCYSNNLTSLDLSKNINLKVLSCSNNQFTNLDLSKHINLQVLSCSNNQFTNLDLSKNINLKKLDCSENLITSLDLSNNIDLRALDCSENLITDIILADNLNIEDVVIYSNKLSKAAMQKIIDKMPVAPKKFSSATGLLLTGHFVAVDNKSNVVDNYISKEQVKTLKAKGWIVRDYNGDGRADKNDSESIFYGINFEGYDYDYIDPKEVAITFTTSKAIGETITLEIMPNDGETITIEGVNETFSQGNKIYTLNNSEVKIYGNIIYLNCSKNNITSLDLSKNPNLHNLSCRDNQLTQLDISKNTKLQNLSCDGNQLTALDISKNTNLEYLDCPANQLTTLDLSKNTKLKHLNCSANQFTTLDLSKNTNLEHLNCSANQFTTLDLSKNTNLKDLRCHENQLTVLDISKNIRLKYLNCSENLITDITFPTFPQKTNLKNIRLYGNKISKASMQNIINNLPSLNNLSSNDRNNKGFFVVVNNLSRRGAEFRKGTNFISKEQVKAIAYKGWKARNYNYGTPDPNDSNSYFYGIDFEGYDEVVPSIIKFTTSKNIGETITLSITPKDGETITIEGVNEAFSQGNKVYTLNSSEVKIHGDISSLDCSKNNITSLDISKCKKLRDLYCHENQLTQLDISQNTKLQVLLCFKNQLTQLDISQNTELVSLYCSENRLNRLDVSRNRKLYYLYCNDNELTNLYLTDNIKLNQLACHRNQLRALDISKNTALQQLYCHENQLTTLDISKNIELQKIYCNYNQIENIVMPQSSNINNILLFGNKLTRAAMQKIIDRLPTLTLPTNGEEPKGYFVVVNKHYIHEANFISKDQVKKLAYKNWKARDYNEGKDENNSKFIYGIAFEGEEVAPQEPSITFTTSRAIGETITLTITPEDGETITIDGVNEAYSEDNNTYTLNSQTIKIYGQISTFKCSDNNITSLDISKSPNLRWLKCDNNQLTSLDISKNTNLQNLGCYNNQLIALDLSKNPNLSTLTCYNNQLTSLDISKNTNLSTLACDNNQLTNLDISKNTRLLYLYCSRNSLTNLDLSKNTRLNELSCNNNQLTNLDLSKNTRLNELSCNNNQLTNLDLSKNTELQNLYCDNNKIANIVLPDSPLLKNIELFANKLNKEAMQSIIDKLVTLNLVTDYDNAHKGYFVAVNKKNSEEANFISKEQVKALRDKGWKVRDFNNGIDENNSYSPYGINFEGDDEVAPQEPSIIFTTSKTIGETITLEITPKKGETITIEGVNEAYSQGNRSYTLNSQTIKIYGQITAFHCNESQLTSLDISKDTELKDLQCYDNQLTSLDISKNTNLQKIICPNNQLTSLDISRNPNLKSLGCSNNQLTNLDISKNPKLEFLNCSVNQLTVLDISKNPKLQKLHCNNNKLTVLDLSENTNLQRLYCPNNQLTSLDISKNIKLRFLYCEYNQISEIIFPDDNQNLQNISLFANKLEKTAIQKIIDKLPTLDLSTYEQYHEGNFIVVNNLYDREENFISKEQVKALTAKAWKVRDYNNGKNERNRRSDFGIAFEGFDEIAPKEPSITFNTSKEIGETIELKLTPKEGETITIEGVNEAYSEDNRNYTLKNQTIKIYGQIITLDCSNNNITSLDLSENPELQELYCFNNQLTSLDLSKNVNLQRLNCSNNQLTALYLSKGTNLQSLYCNNNQLTSLDLSKNINLQELVCSENQLTSLDISRNPNLESLGCSNNQLTNLDISKNPNLMVLNCSNNQLTNLDISKHTDLRILYCSNNQLTSLDISKHTDLQILYCYDNKIEKIVLPESSNINNILLYGNKLTKDAIQKVIDKLPTLNLSNDEQYDKGFFVVVNKQNREEANFISKGQVKALAKKGWRVRDYNNGFSDKGEESEFGIAFEGEEDPTEKEDTTSISEVSTSSVSIYPNPATSYLIVKGLAYNSIAKLYNMAGELVLETIVSDDTRIDLSKLPSARYILVVDGKAHQILINK